MESDFIVQIEMSNTKKKKKRKKEVTDAAEGTNSLIKICA